MGHPAPKRSRGQTLIGVIIGLLFLMITVPAILFWSQQDSKASAKAEKSQAAFNLAEGAVNRGYWYMVGNVPNFKTIVGGGTLSNYNFDKVYTDDPSGTYTVRISSASDQDTILITGIGRDGAKREVRAVSAYYSKNYLGNVAIQAANGATLSGNNFQVEWGGVVSPKTITANGKSHPQFWSKVGIDLDTNGSTPANCDSPSCCQWHSYDERVPDNPVPDLDFYKSSAQATGTYYTSAQTWKSLNYVTGNTYYIEGDLTIQSPGIYVQGDVIVMGNVNLPNGAWGNGTVTANVPTDAWKQYCNDWSFYRTTYDSVAPTSFPGLTGTYKSASTLTYTTGSKVAFNGFVYTSGNFGAGGGGGASDIVGVVIINGSVTLAANSQARIYYSPTTMANLRTTSLALGRQSWREVSTSWPSGLD